jgi:uncharacterized lipoprotein YajG
VRHFGPVLLIAAGLLALCGCASPTIVINPSLPAPALSSSPGPGVDVRLDVREAAGSRFEEKSDKTLIGKSESLGVHVSDFWMEEPPARFVQRLIEANLKAWGHRVVQNGERVYMRAQVNRVSLDNKAVSALEFQADGMIDVVLEVVAKDSKPGYRRQYLATCTFRTATSLPNKDNMERTFNQCVDEFQKRISEDGALRAALADIPKQ